MYIYIHIICWTEGWAVPRPFNEPSVTTFVQSRETKIIYNLLRLLLDSELGICVPTQVIYISEHFFSFNHQNVRHFTLGGTLFETFSWISKSYTKKFNKIYTEIRHLERGELPP